MTTVSGTQGTRRAYLERQGRKARDVSLLVFEGCRSANEASSYERADLARRVTAFHQVLRRLHRLPSGLRRDLLLYDELDVRFLGDEHLVEPLPAPAMVAMDHLCAGGPLHPDEVCPRLLRLLELCVELQLHGIPPHRMLSPERIYWSDDGIQVADFGLSTLLPHFIRKPELTRDLMAFAAPELLGGHAQARGDLADVHALGCIAARLLLVPEDFPFLQARDGRDKYVLPPPVFARDGVPPDVARILAAMCAPDPGRRPSLMRALVDLTAAWRHGAAVHVDQDPLNRRVGRFLRAVVESPRVEIHAAASALVEKRGMADLGSRSLMRKLAPVIGLLTAAEVRSGPTQAQLALVIETIRSLLTAGPVSLRPLLCVALAGVAVHHLLALDPLAAAAVLAQVCSLRALVNGPDGEHLQVFIVTLELGCALASGSARELFHVREEVRAVARGALGGEIASLVHATVELALGDLDTARCTLEGLRATGTVASGLAGHLRAHLELMLELEGMEIGPTLETLDASTPGRARLLGCVRQERALRIFSQIDRPVVIFLQDKAGGPRIKVARRRGPATAAFIWHRRMRSALTWGRRRVRALAITHYLDALPMLPRDALGHHHIEIYVWLAEAHLGLSREVVAAEYLAPAAGWLMRLPVTPRSDRLSKELREGQHWFAAGEPRPAQPVDSILRTQFHGLDGDVARNGRRVAHWLMARLLAEFHGTYVSLSLQDSGGEPLPGGGGSAAGRANRAYDYDTRYITSVDILREPETSADQPTVWAEARGALSRAHAANGSENLASDALLCHTMIRNEMHVELRFAGYPFRTFDRRTHLRLGKRLDELAPAFMLVEDWDDEAPPVPTQLGAMHVMAHEAKRPLLWLQRGITELASRGELSLDGRRRLDWLLDVCALRLAAFCGTKLWEFGDVDLNRQIAELAREWKLALALSGEDMDLVYAPPTLAQEPLRIRGLAVELIVSELLENARKHGRARGAITLGLETSLVAGRCAVCVKICNYAEEGATEVLLDTRGRAGRFRSTGLGQHLIKGLVDQLDGCIGQRVERDETGHTVYITELLFTADFACSWADEPSWGRE